MSFHTVQKRTNIGLPLIVTQLINTAKTVTNNTAEAKANATRSVILTGGAVAAGLIIFAKLIRKI